MTRQASTALTKRLAIALITVWAAGCSGATAADDGASDESLSTSESALNEDLPADLVKLAMEVADLTRQVNEAKAASQCATGAYRILFQNYSIARNTLNSRMATAPINGSQAGRILAIAGKALALPLAVASCLLIDMQSTIADSDISRYRGATVTFDDCATATAAIARAENAYQRLLALETTNSLLTDQVVRQMGVLIRFISSANASTPEAMTLVAMAKTDYDTAFNDYCDLRNARSVIDASLAEVRVFLELAYRAQRDACR